MSETEAQPNPKSPARDALEALPYKEDWLDGPNSHKFFTRTYPAPGTSKAVILFVHGFAEHLGRYEHVHVNYPKHGITVFAYDQRGFGRTALDGKHKSAGSKYGKTSWKWQLEDIEFWLKHLREKYPGVPLFLMGHSMGGGLVCGFSTRAIPPPSPETVNMLSGVIASSPLILVTTPPAKLLRFVGDKLCLLFPFATFPAEVPADDLSRNAEANAANLKDPLIKRSGTLRGLHDMFAGGEELLASNFKNWPKNLPVLFVHGTADKVTSCKATQEFYDKIPAEDKTMSLYEGGYHELVHEIDGIPDRLMEEIVSWVEKRLTLSPPLTETAPTPKL